MDGKNKLSENSEDYLEVILNLQNTQKVARSKEIAKKLNIQRGSITGMLKKLSREKLVNYEPYGFITLTQKGEKIAREIKRHHIIIKDFLFRVLQIEEKKADATACRMEHAMDKSTVDMLLKFIAFIDKHPGTDSNWIQEFIDFCSDKE